MKHEDITEKIIGAAFKVHNVLGFAVFNQWQSVRIRVDGSWLDGGVPHSTVMLLVMGAHLGHSP